MYQKVLYTVEGALVPELCLWAQINLEQALMTFCLLQCFPTFFNLLLKIAPRRWVDTPSLSFPNHARTIMFSQKCTFISIARPIKREQMKNYNH